MRVRVCMCVQLTASIAAKWKRMKPTYEQRLRSTGSTGYANESGVNEVSASVSERVCVCVVVAVSICETASGR